MSLAYVEKQCQECGKYYNVHPQNFRSFRCPECQREANIERWKKREYEKRKREGTHILRTALVVEYDPLPFDDGGFRKGAYILKEEWGFMKAHEVISDGFRVKYPSGKVEVYQRG